ncbi:MAG: hypothetical protein L6247_00515, partial [Desulfobacteraceae bacterium]|nr:hypothetical protein [Desulfobacteraceae bacterium]
MEHIVIRVHPASVFEPEWIINYQVHACECVTSDFKFALCQADYEGILITSFLEELVENSKVIVSQVAEIINPGRVESRKVIVKVVSNEFALS